MAYQGIFKRHEIKYIITDAQRRLLLEYMQGHMKEDEYGKSLICSLYFDTPDFRIIRASMQKPTVYKEKLRIRCYGVPSDTSLAFAELKKKYKGIVYKRRICLPYIDAHTWLADGGEVSDDSQIAREIEYFREFYRELAPAVVLSYERRAYYSEEDRELRLTLDENIRYRFDRLDLRLGAQGESLTDCGMYLMEIKLTDPMPLWLSHALCALEIYPSSYSKYANAYTRAFLQKIQKERQPI